MRNLLMVWLPCLYAKDLTMTIQWTLVQPPCTVFILSVTLYPVHFLYSEGLPLSSFELVLLFAVSSERGVCVSSVTSWQVSCIVCSLLPVLSQGKVTLQYSPQHWEWPRAMPRSSVTLVITLRCVCSACLLHGSPLHFLYAAFWWSTKWCLEEKE